jgi:hypothetical protein
MAGVPVLAYQQFWRDKRPLLTNELKNITSKYPDATPRVHQLLKVFRDIENQARYTPVSDGESEEYAAIISLVEDNRETYCKTLYGTYTVMLSNLNKVLKASTQQEKGFNVVRRWKRHYTKEASRTANKAAILTFSPHSGQRKWTLMPLAQSPAQQRKRF